MMRPPPRSPLFPSTPLFRSQVHLPCKSRQHEALRLGEVDLVVDSLPPLLMLRRAVPLQVSRVRESRRSISSGGRRSEEHTSELQSLAYLVCRLLLEKKKKEN